MTESYCLLSAYFHSGRWVSPLAVLLSAGVAARIALHSIASQREIARKRATLDMILKSESDAYFERIYDVFVTEKARGDGFKSFLEPKTDSEKKLRSDINNFLNHYELIAISIRENILDESFYKEWMRTTYINHYVETREYIEGIRKRENFPKAFIEFQTLAEKWKADHK